MPVGCPPEHSTVPEMLRNSIGILREVFRDKTSGDILVEVVRSFPGERLEIGKEGNKRAGPKIRSPCLRLLLLRSLFRLQQYEPVPKIRGMYD